jgi:ABC-type glutathione transport system ATPase component
MTEPAPPHQAASPRAVLEVAGLSVRFPRSPAPAVDNVTLQVFPGTTLGIAGESGCGKSTLARTILGLLTPSAGRVLIEGRDMHQSAGKVLKASRRRVQMIFQDPAGSLNPRMTVREAVCEPLIVHGEPTQGAAEKAIVECGLGTDALDRYPHQFSGGQRQRIAIARALILRPALVICDEPTSALDVSVQAHILNLLKELQSTLGVAYLFITHDMGVLGHMADRIAVMQRGRIIETGDARDVLTNPREDLTKRLAKAAGAGVS